jgi:hypothetical protein
MPYMRGTTVLVLTLVLWASPAAAQPPEPPSAEDQSIQLFLQAVETSISSMDRRRWTDLLSVNADAVLASEFFVTMVPDGITRAVVKERDRAPLLGTLPGDGYRLITDIFIETGPRGRIATWSLDIRKPRGESGEPQPWRLVAMERLSAVEGLHRLALAADTQFTARALSVQSVDFELRLPAGEVFAAETSEGVTALVLLGNGVMRFAPEPREERGQVRIFAGRDELETPFTAALVRLNPKGYDALVEGGMLVKSPSIDLGALRRARTVFDEDIGNSFSLDLSDLSRDTWSLLPQPGDFVAEVRTRRHDKLTYARSTGEPEDVSLFQRARKRNISIYASEQKLATRGRFYNEDDLVEFDLLDYAVDATFTPARDWLEGRTRLRLRVQSFYLPAITLKLAESLTVNSVVSAEFGRLMFLRVRNQSAIVVNLPEPVTRGFTLTLDVSYQGRMTRQSISDDSVAVSADQQPPTRTRDFAVIDDLPLVPPEQNWLFSNRAQWYPQGTVTDYATGTIRVTVPSEYTVVASGVPAMGSPLVTGALPSGLGGQALFSFTVAQPVRYMSMVVSKLQRADAATVALDIVPDPAADTGGGPRSDPGEATPAATAAPAVGSRNTLALTVEANRRQETRGREALPTVAEIARLYASIVGDVPYDALTVAMVEADLPGGHAPAYMAVINNPPPASQLTWRNDPAAFSNFPEFFLAHEVAHQWFGQAVGWKNYHEQWLSEGFAQYFAALYARERRGESAFRDIVRQFRKWSIDTSDEGPIHLGYRLGHIKNEPRVFRALVYNKGAAVLHMLRRLLGDEVFFAGVRRFYREHRFQKAGSADLRAALEAESGGDLERFFERWVYDSGIPRIRYSTTVSPDAVLVRLEQGTDLYDLPVTVTVLFTDGRVHEEVIRLTDATAEAHIPVQGGVRTVEINQDGAALAHFERMR